MEASKLIVKVFSLIPEFKKPLKDHKKGILLAIKTFTSVILMQSDLKTLKNTDYLVTYKTSQQKNNGQDFTKMTHWNM